MRVVLISATTICGRISPAGQGSVLDRRRLESARSDTGASLIGASTLRIEDPEMRCMGGMLPENRVRAVITGSGQIPVNDRKLFNKGPKPIIFTSKKMSDGISRKFAERAKVIPLASGPQGLSIAAAIEKLGEMGAESVLIEGGGRHNYAALAEGIVDEIYLTIMPSVSGEKAGTSLA
ncbi:MAG: RibD family protein, partial [Proteobacteria bacterium]|nr:RibD family protein [Pseudomonadota bacterium]